MEPLIALLLSIIVLGLVFSLLYWLVQQIPMLPQIRIVVNVSLAIIAVIVLLSIAFGGFPVPILRTYR